MLTGAALGALLALIPAGVAWKMRHGKLRPYAALTVIGGIAGGAIVARRKRWSDEEVALYLDGELASEEAISTAVDFDTTGPDSETDPAMRAVVMQSAATALHDGDRKRAKPTMLRPVHLLIPVALAGVAFITRAPLPPAPIVATDPGTTKVQIAEVDGLEKIDQARPARSARRSAARAPREDRASDAEKLERRFEQGPREARGAGPDREAARRRSRRSA